MAGGAWWKGHGRQAAGGVTYWAARAELLAKTGARGEARRAYEMAIGLERDPGGLEDSPLQRRQSALRA